MTLHAGTGSVSCLSNIRCWKIDHMLLLLLKLNIYLPSNSPDLNPPCTTFFTTLATNQKVKVKSLSHVQLLATPWTVAYQAPPSMGFSRQEYWNGLPFPSPGDLPNPGIKPWSPSFQADALPSEPSGKPPTNQRPHVLMYAWKNQDHTPVP